jgi:hypothetical protein
VVHGAGGFAAVGNAGPASVTPGGTATVHTVNVGQRRRESVAPENAADGTPCGDDGSIDGDCDVDSGDDVRQPAATGAGQGGATTSDVQRRSSQPQQQEDARRRVSIGDRDGPVEGPGGHNGAGSRDRWGAAGQSLAPRSSRSPSRHRSHSCDVTGARVHSSSPGGDVGAGSAQPAVVAPHVATTGAGKESERRFSVAVPVTFNRHVHADGTVTTRRSNAAAAAGGGGSLSSASGGGSSAERLAERLAERSFTPSEVDLGMQAPLTSAAVPANRRPSHVAPPPPQLF